MAEGIGTASADKDYHFFELVAAVEVAAEETAAATAAASRCQPRLPRTCFDLPHCRIHQTELVIAQRYQHLRHLQDWHLRHLVGVEEEEAVKVRFVLVIVEMVLFLRRLEDWRLLAL